MKGRTRLNAGWSAMALLVAVGCGGDTSTAGSQQCPDYAPCGGDVVGTWELVDACLGEFVSGAVTESLDTPECRDVIQSMEPNLTGTIEFRDDGTVNEQVSGTVQTSFKYTKSCIEAANDVVMTQSEYEAGCARVSARLAAEADFTDASCSMSVGTCRCSAVSPVDFDDVSAYTVSGSAFESATFSYSDFCVQGDTLTLRESGSDGDGFSTYRRVPSN